MQKNPDTVKGFLKALSEAGEYCHQHPQETYAIVAKKIPTLTPETIAKMAVDFSYRVRFLKEDQSNLDDVAKWVLGIGKIKSVPDWHKAVDTSELKAVNAKAVDPGL